MKQTFTGLQILRFVAAMLVAVMHITQAISIHITGQGEHVYWGTGAVGVDIFFIISGFVMMISTAKVPFQGPHRADNAWIFIKRRILRIVPLYWFYTLLKAALIIAVPALAVKSVIEPWHLGASLAFVPVTAPWGLIQPVLPVGWTLNFEMLFYVVFAAAIALGAPRVRHCLLVFLCVFVAARFFPASVPLGFYAQSIIFEFIIGVAFAQAVLRWGVGPAGAGAVLMAAGAIFTFGLGWDPGSDRLFPWGVGSAAIVLGMIWLERLVDGKRWAKPLAFLGDASYSIYLSHTFVVPATVIALKKIGVHDTLFVFTLASLAVMAAGSLSYIWIEKPLIAVFKRLLFRPALTVSPHAANTASN
ncbi:MAG TPA: acyltransferase [Ramlibacter sp.]|nr:acyltransferase [Ramlibacter sp.]